MIDNLHQLTIAKASKLLKSKRISAVELAKSALDQIDQIESKLNAFIKVSNKKLVLTQAKTIDNQISSGKLTSPLAGIPVAIKDSFLTNDLPATAGSNILTFHISQYDSTVVKRLKQNGAIIIGKTNLDEFSMGFTTETSAFKTTSNPWDLSRTPGGSSGGSAAATAADAGIFSIGSEHYDSIRQPAAWCSVVGLKPSYGLVSRYGIVAMASSLECPGPITKTVEDAAIVLSLIAGHDPKDANSVNQKIPQYSKELKASIKGLKIGIAKDYFSKDLDPGVLKVTKSAINQFKSLGAKLIDINLPSIKHTSSIFEVLYRSEVASNLARYDGIRYGKTAKIADLKKLYLQTRKNFGPLLKYLMITDLRAISGGEFDRIYLDALRLRTLITQDFNTIFNQVDLVVSPMSPALPFKKGFYHHGKYHGTKETDKFRPIVDIIAQLPALCGYPGISVPCGFSQNLPVGLNLYGPMFSETLLLSAAHAYEQATSWHKQKPKLT